MAVEDVDDPVSVLVLRALGLGDLLTAVPALRGLRRHFPASRLLLAAPRGYRDLALHTGAVDDVVDTPRLGPIRGLREPPTMAVNLHGCGPQSIAALLELQPQRLLTHRHNAYPDLAGPAWQPDLHEVDRWCALLQWAGILCRTDDLRLDRPDGYPDCSNVVVVHPGAAAPARRWPAARYAAVAAALARQGSRIVVTGSAGEADLVRAVVEQAGLPDSAARPPSTDLLSLVALIADSRLVICGDTGVGHVATATGTPSVLLFGPTPPQLWGPRGDGRHVVLWAGERGDPHADSPDPGLLRITVGDVLGAADDALARCA